MTAKALPDLVVCIDDVQRSGPVDAQHMSGLTESRYDVIVIGAGPIGQTVADRARAAGLSVATVERELVGGECSSWRGWLYALGDVNHHALAGQVPISRLWHAVPCFLSISEVWPRLLEAYRH